MSYDYVIIGGGCYGTYFVDQLREARSRDKLDWSRLAVLDRDADCAVARAGHDDVDVIAAEWTTFGPTVFSEPDLWLKGQLVPAPIAPHILMHWLSGALAELRGVRARPTAFDGAVPDLPYAAVTDAGTLVLSWAPGLCPTNCVEPRMCPLTGGVRTWDMPDTVAEVAAREGFELMRFACRHHAYGVGTIGGAAILDAWDLLRGLELPATVGFATTSGCHGLLDLVTFDCKT